MKRQMYQAFYKLSNFTAVSVQAGSVQGIINKDNVRLCKITLTYVSSYSQGPLCVPNDKEWDLTKPGWWKLSSADRRHVCVMMNMTIKSFFKA